MSELNFKSQLDFEQSNLLEMSGIPDAEIEKNGGVWLSSIDGTDWSVSLTRENAVFSGKKNYFEKYNEDVDDVSAYFIGLEWTY